MVEISNFRFCNNLHPRDFDISTLRHFDISIKTDPSDTPYPSGRYY